MENTHTLSALNVYTHIDIGEQRDNPEALVKKEYRFVDEKIDFDIE